MHLRTQDLQQRQIEVTIHQYSSPKLIYMGSMYISCINRRAELVKVLVLIGGMLITGITRHGDTIDNRPTVGSIAQTDVGYYGHVMFVERVNNDGSILVSEMNYSAAPGILTYRTVPAYQVNNYRYIH